jgi:uncharacterized protein
VNEIVDFQDMWRLIERGCKRLSKEEKVRLESAAVPFEKHVEFQRFDGNNESNHLGVAQFFIECLGRWQEFKGRELNSHVPTLDRYRCMYRAFERFNWRPQGDSNPRYRRERAMS